MPDEMNKPDYIIFNGLRMRHDYAESLQAAQSFTHYHDGTQDFARVTYGQETFRNASIAQAQPCPCCSTLLGQLHEPLCEYEQCPKCGRQVMSCDCPFYAPEEEGGTAA